ncbi:hypothetical protein M427DRAFT_65772 [Gonapodya prolifera JEL478]|uniref:S-adenosyl-L-methionine-dependent methyltransferase n=1 Tax=Gonapodya prolifera (strain JEL478) TaxID=1344416 RepID=A0A139AYR1_GONPJ|nr:hypothetical protein M427DRAFT_65772 [Gonapodya prolifera JEL478]|eukprot:KXS21840.1 hypothetical protein M427DRAFT_65772 [Gonapodya prolifera JEL478]
MPGFTLDQKRLSLVAIYGEDGDAEGDVEEELWRLFSQSASPSVPESFRTHPHHRLPSIDFEWIFSWGAAPVRKEVLIHQDPGTHFGGEARTGSVCWRSGMVLANMISGAWGRELFSNVTHLNTKPLRLLELGTGSGLLAVSLLLTLKRGLPFLFPSPASPPPIVHVTLTDADERALAIARRNVNDILGTDVIELDFDDLDEHLSNTAGANTTKPSKCKTSSILTNPRLFVSYLHLDWTIPPTYPTLSTTKSHPSLVFATDVAYNELLVPYFVNAARNVMGHGTDSPESIGAPQSVLVLAQELRAAETHRTLLTHLLESETGQRSIHLWRVDDASAKGGETESSTTVNNSGVVVYVAHG